MQVWTEYGFTNKASSECEESPAAIKDSSAGLLLLVTDWGRLQGSGAIPVTMYHIETGHSFCANAVGVRGGGS